MKKNIFIITTLAISIIFSSCTEEFKNWYSETAEYDGRYVVATTCEEYSDGDTSIEDGVELKLYNTASNAADELWLETAVYEEPVKTKIKITGNSTSFVSNEVTENTHANIYMLRPSGALAAFTQANAVRDYGAATAAYRTFPGIQLYTKVKVEEGKIIPDAATTIGGNKSDSVYVKVLLQSDFLTFESYQTPESSWRVAGVPEFAWRLKAGSNTPAPADWDEHWTLAGYRYTGFPEDAAH